MSHISLSVLDLTSYFMRTANIFDLILFSTYRKWNLFLSASQLAWTIIHFSLITRLNIFKLVTSFKLTLEPGGNLRGFLRRDLWKSLSRQNIRLYGYYVGAVWVPFSDVKNPSKGCKNQSTLWKVKITKIENFGFGGKLTKIFSRKGSDKRQKFFSLRVGFLFLLGHTRHLANLVPPGQT